MSHSQSSHRAERSRRGRSPSSTTPPKNPYELKPLSVPRGLLPRQASAPEVGAPPAPSGPAPGGRATARHAAAAGRRRRHAERPETLRRLVPRALVVAFLAGGTTAFIAHDKAIRLNVDGSPRTLHTFADDVDDLLADEHLDIGRHDAVTPAPSTALTHGDEVVLRRGRPVVLTLDGDRRLAWTTAETVDGALRQLGVRAEGAHLSTSRHRRIGPRGLELSVRTERSLVFIADGRAHRVRTNAATIRDALAQAGLALRDEDTTSVPPDSFPREGQTVSVLRITGANEVRDEPIPFRTVRRAAPDLIRGTESVVQEGRPGVRRVTYRLRTVNGVKQKPQRVGARVVRRPRPQIVHIGTKELPSSVQGADHLSWDALAQCEAGGRPDAVDSTGTYGGLYQFDVATWHDLGGHGRPQDASAAEQTYRAKKLYVTRGASPWPVCGRKLHQ
ncbi:resuscitation-promoting factor [Streptomyces halobius]|uniref:Ubiquitin-like domain-containing protein n=1 Tax=Streptomyces halobius TaxID=2879846 RepID=A0ABY4MD02_9ACTN|nr:resuscitation-promoting factor [Streptomyces halobius]UQA94978.1 ubiquitin-like domain-containing protein [Streptomyces halobius]